MLKSKVNNRLIALLSTLALVGVMLTPYGPINAATPVNLNTWDQQGAAGAGNWTVAGGGTSVLQSINGAPTMFVSPNEFINTSVSGSFRVERTGDDDFIGFVFGYQAPLGADPVNDVDFLLLDWKQGAQEGASAGFRLAKVLGTHNGSSGVDNPVWPHSNNANITFTSLGTPLVNAGWQDNQTYAFDLVYQQANIEIYIQGGTGAFVTKQKIFDVDINDHLGVFTGNVFPSGRFGFYNYSQEDVRYTSFTQADDPILQTAPATGETLDMGPVRVGTSSAPGDLTITNAASVGSTLTGTVASASGEFAGPTPDAAFSLAEGADSVKQFVYTPAALGPDTQDILVTSDGGSSLITLAGNGVGPVYGDDSGGTLDIGIVDSAGSVGEAFIELTNLSTDGLDNALTDLTILSAVITGPDALLFSTPEFAPEIISEGDTLLVKVLLDATGASDGLKTALLTFSTDQGEALGVAGATFEVLLTGEVVPEPATMAILLLGGIAVLRKRKCVRR
jgi:hypothetical protein